MHFITVTAQRFGALPPCARIPQTHGLARRRRREKLAIAGELQATDPGSMSLEGGNPLAGIAIPDLRIAAIVAGSGDEKAAVRRNIEGGESID